MTNQPYSLDAERAVLGACLKDPEALPAVLEIGLTPDCFYDKVHVEILTACVDLYGESKPVDTTTVNEALGGLIGTQLLYLWEYVASTANVATHAQIVYDKYVLRELIRESNAINQSCYGSDPVSEILDRAEAGIFSIAESQIKSGFEVADTSETLDRIESILAGNQVSGLKTGFHELDKLTMGLHDGDLTIIAGRPSMGKTGLAMNIAENVAKHTGVGIFSLEMSKRQLTDRMTGGQAMVDLQRIREGNVTSEQFDAMKRVDLGQIFIDVSCTLTSLEMRAKARRLCARNDIGLIIVDYIQLMSGYGDNRQQEVTAISRSLKALARELSLPVIAVSQLSRQVESRATKIPTLSDLRESGAIEQDADVVAFVHRPEYYWDQDEKDADAVRSELHKQGGKANIIVAKQRNGPTGTVRLAFVDRYARFENLTCNEVPNGVY